MQIEKVNNSQNIKNLIRLDKSYLNYSNIINKNLPYKFSYLDEWLLKKSKLLLKETNEFSKMDLKNKAKGQYRVYDRGTIIKADFGVNLGSEMSQVHFAIVLNNYDNQKNNILTVVPLTSKKSKFNLDLGPLVIGKLIDKVKLEINKIASKEEKLVSSVENKIKIKKLLTLLSYYKSNEKNTYACCSLVTTISKSRIFPPINEFDIIGRKKCSKEVLDKIDEELITKFTKINLTKE